MSCDVTCAGRSRVFLSHKEHASYTSKDQEQGGTPSVSRHVVHVQCDVYMYVHVMYMSCTCGEIIGFGRRLEVT